MKTKLYAATCVAMLLTFAFSNLHAQAPGPGGAGPASPGPGGAGPGGASPAGQRPSAARPDPRGTTGGDPSTPNVTHGVAVIDITYILDHYARLKQQMDVYKRDVEKADSDFKRERDGLLKKQEVLKTLKSGTPDFKAKEEELAKLKSDFELKVARQRSDFGERESKMYLDAYREITNQVKAYSDRNGISLVLRFNGAPIDPMNPQAVQAEVFKMVMYYSKDIDITYPILQQLNRGATVAQPPRGGSAPVRK